MEEQGISSCETGHSLQITHLLKGLQHHGQTWEGELGVWAGSHLSSGLENHEVQLAAHTAQVVLMSLGCLSLSLAFFFLCSGEVISPSPVSAQDPGICSVW